LKPTSEVNIVHCAGHIEMDTVENIDKRYQEQNGRSVGTFCDFFIDVEMLLELCS